MLASVHLHRFLRRFQDEECLKFLGNTVKAMKPGYSRLLINEQVLPDVGAELHPAMLDMTMLTYSNAMERTERQWRTLLGNLGVEIVKIWRNPLSVTSIVELIVPKL